MRVAICDDVIVEQSIIKDLLHKNIDLFEQEELHVFSFNSGEELISSYEQGNRFNLVFVDMRMKEMNGIETIKGIKKMDSLGIVIITTSLIEYAIEGYQVDATEFLLKPIQEEKFIAAVKHALREFEIRHNGNQDKTYIIEHRDESIGIRLDDIYYFESYGRKISIKSKKGVFEQYKNISTEEKNLRHEGFVRTHRSYLVNLKNIYRVKSSGIVLSNNELLPVSPRRLKTVYDEFTEYMIGGIK